MFEHLSVSLRRREVVHRRDRKAFCDAHTGRFTNLILGISLILARGRCALTDETRFR